MQKNQRNNASGGSLAGGIMGLISSAVSAVANIVPISVAKRENTKNWIQQVLYSPVYLNGKSLDTVKSLHSITYQKNPTLFLQYYEDYISQRIADLEAGKHPSQQLQIEDVVKVGFVIILVIIMIKVWTK